MGYVFIALLEYLRFFRLTSSTSPPLGRHGPEEFACAVNAETLAEMVGSAATWLSSAVSTCVLAFQDLFWALGKQLGPHQTGVQ